jgi:aminocarboxymuconate-semialdehyde decarboxylase
MDLYEGLVQVLTLASPAIEENHDSRVAVDLAKLANDELARLVTKYPDRFVTAVAALPMNDIEAALTEIDRAIRDLQLKGIQLFTPVNDKPLDSPEFLPIYEKMAQYDLPIWIHPTRNADYPDYRSEKESKYVVHSVFGWPFETAVAMTRLVFSGVFDKWPKLKFITHHCGGMVPFFEGRIVGIYEKAATVVGTKFDLKKPLIEYYRMFYNDTALYGSTPSLMCGYAMFGADHMLFGTDMPLGDSQGGMKNTGKTIESIEGMNIPPEDKNKIFEANTRNLLHLP